MTGRRREAKNGQEIDDKLATLNNKVVSIERSSHRLYKLLSTVLDVSRIRTRIRAKFLHQLSLSAVLHLFSFRLFFPEEEVGGLSYLPQNLRHAIW